MSTDFMTGFNSSGYNGSNYVELLQVDRDVISLVLQGFRMMDIEPRSIVGDVICACAGPTPIDGMLMQIFHADGFWVRSADISNSNTIDVGHRVSNGVPVYTKPGIYGHFGPVERVDTRSPFVKFDREIAEKGPEIFPDEDPALFQGSFLRYRWNAKPTVDNMSRLLPGMFAGGTSFYGAESAKETVEGAAQMWTSFFGSLEKGAPFAVAAVAESEGYSGGKYTRFPAASIDEAGFREIFDGMPVEYHLEMTEHTFRPGHGGVAVVTGKKLYAPAA